MENTNHGHQVTPHPEAEEFISADPNHASNSGTPVKPSDLQSMPKNADTDPNRYSNFNLDSNNNSSQLKDNNSNNGKDHNASEEGSTSQNAPSNDSNSNFSGIPHYSIEDDRHLGRKSWDTEEEDEKKIDAKTKISASDKEGFFEGL